MANEHESPTWQPPPQPDFSATFGFPPETFDYTRLPDVDTEFLSAQDLDAFVRALQAPDPLQSPSTTALSPDELGPLSPPLSLRSNGNASIAQRFGTPDEREDEAAKTAAVAASAAAAADSFVPPTTSSRKGSIDVPTSPRLPLGRHASKDMFFTAAHDWAPVNTKIPKPSKRGSSKRKRRAGRAAAALLGQRSKDETREGYLYVLFKWPLLLLCGVWLGCLAVGYALTRSYIFLYEHLFTWRGHRERLRRNMHGASSYNDWVAAAKQLDVYLGRQAWKEENAFAYYDSKTVKTVWEQMRRVRQRVQAADKGDDSEDGKAAVDELMSLLEACVKSNFVGTESARLYSQTYYGTKVLVQNFIDELEKSLHLMLETNLIGAEEKRAMYKRVHAHYGRTALCLSGGAAFAYYHFGVIRALLDADMLPDVITGTSGGALVAALVATRTNEELRQLLIPALARKIDACSEGFTTWFPRWWRTGARFDSVDWARRSAWWTRGSTTFREAYARTGRILNVTCVPADPHSPTMLCNYMTSPDCVIWSAMLASAAVPGILNPVVLMMKQRDGSLAPYSFGHKWKDGSLRTDIPIKALNLQFNVNFTIVSQVNPHVNLFFFSARGRVGDPVTHRKGRGWRGGFLMSALEHWIRLDMNKWLRFVRAAELLPRPLGQDWSQLWLQQFNGTVTLWPKVVLSDFWRILSDPDETQLARMMHEGMQCAFPILKFVGNRLKVERLVERGWRDSKMLARGGIESMVGGDCDDEGLLPGVGSGSGVVDMGGSTTGDSETDVYFEGLQPGLGGYEGGGSNDEVEEIGGNEGDDEGEGEEEEEEEEGEDEEEEEEEEEEESKEQLFMSPIHATVEMAGGDRF